MALKYNPITGEFEVEKPVLLSDLVFDPVLGEFKAVERKSVVKKQSHDLVAQFKQCIRYVLKKTQVNPGVTTVLDMVRLGYTTKEYGAFVAISKSSSFGDLFSYSKIYVDRVEVMGNKIPNNNFFKARRSYNEWNTLFRNLGLVCVCQVLPHEYLDNNWHRNYSATMSVNDNANSFQIDIYFFKELLFPFSQELSVPIYRIELKYDITKIDQFNAWLYDTDNRVNLQTCHSEKSYSITGDKTVKQIIESPLGDASVDFSTATFDSLREWIKRNGELEEKEDWMYFKNVPTKLLGHKVDYLSIFNQAKGFGVIISLDFNYKEHDSIVKKLHDAIEVGETISNHLQELGFSMKEGILPDPKFDKFNREGELKNRKVMVRIIGLENFSILKIWLYVNK